ncbi:MAG TPA: glutamate--tRNA ligase [Bacillota bacterium]|nr:glutamate--tRNA ligase [Bacillota bacterium]
MTEKRVRVRFAPSPTGFLHIGGARTALYNWLFAKANGGDFILRIEDTDRTRYVPEALEDIMASLRWLGLDWDEGPDKGGAFGPYFQSERLPLYKEHAERLVSEGKAYYCFCTPEEIKARAEANPNKAPGYDRHCRNLSPAEIERLKAEGKTYVIRFKTPLDGKTIVHDALRGELVFENQLLDDHVLLKTDGFPTYHLAHAIDDHFMQITHVMRADEWLPSTPRHVLQFQALGWEPPVYAHLPVLLSPDGKGKLSKRHGATSVREYREQGYLPEAMNNFLLLLGWHPSEDREVLSLEEAAKLFTLERINTSGVAFTTDKLQWFNGVYIRSLAPQELAQRCLPYLQRDGLLPDPCPPERFAYLEEIMPLIQERLPMLPEISHVVDFFLQEEIPDPTRELLIPKKTEPQEVLRGLKAAKEHLAQAQSFDETSLEASMRELAESLGVKPGQLFMPIRVAVSGRTATPGLFETLAVLGKERVIKRIAKAIQVMEE